MMTPFAKRPEPRGFSGALPVGAPDTGSVVCECRDKLKFGIPVDIFGSGWSVGSVGMYPGGASIRVLHKYISVTARRVAGWAPETGNAELRPHVDAGSLIAQIRT